MSYTFGDPTRKPEVPYKQSSKYKEIWDKIDITPSTLYLPIIWEDSGDAFKFREACRARKTGKFGRPNPYEDLEYDQIGNTVFVKGRAER